MAKQTVEKNNLISGDTQSSKGIFVSLYSEAMSGKSIHFIIAALIIGVVLIGSTAGIVSIFSHTSAIKLMGDELNELKKEKVLAISENVARKNSLIALRMQEQFETIIKNERKNLVMTKYYYNNYFLCTGMVSLLGIFSAVFLLFISRKGWMNSNPYLLISFLITTGSSIYFSALPALFDYEQNCTVHKNSYVKYNQYKNIYLTFASTGQTIYMLNGKKINSASDFINFIDYSLKKIYDIPFSFNPSAALSNEDIFQKFSQNINTNTQ